jgi:uncharacterized protein
MTSSDFLFYVAVGFAAQLVDGAIGMAYGITATTVLLSMGVAPATASASVHAAEVFTTGASGAAHWQLGNIDRRLVLRLMIPGMVGGAIGAYVLVSLPANLIKPWVNVYLLAVGGYILWKAWRPARERSTPPNGLVPLGFAGGFLDAIGGGGWGPIVTSTLVGHGVPPRYAVGTANCVEFFVTLTITAAFVATIGLSLWPIILALVVGGICAAPFAAIATKHLPDRALMALVGCVVVLLSLRSLFASFV